MREAAYRHVGASSTKRLRRGRALVRADETELEDRA